MIMTMRASAVRPVVAAQATSRRQVTKVHGISRDAERTSMGQVLAAGALSAALLVAQPAMAADLALGKQVFEGNCAACHAGGNNTVIVDHTLKKEAIEKFLDGGLKLEAITYQVQNGKGAMPAWEGTLDDDEIEAVAAYVFDQATGNKW